MAIPVKRKPNIEGTNGSHPPLSTKTKKQILHNVKGTAATVIPINHLVKTRLIKQIPSIPPIKDQTQTQRFSTACGHHHKRVRPFKTALRI